MNILAELQNRFRAALAGLVDEPGEYLEMVRASQDPKFGDYQANFAMPLGKRLGRPPRDVAAQVVQALKVDDLCETAQVEGPGFINLRLKTAFLADAAAQSLTSDRLDVAPASAPRTYVIDFSAPNVAKPMHVGHIRSTVIGDALARTLRFLGHRVITDNHIGDWGTQFGMILYGYKHFRDDAAYQSNPVEELSRLYRLVNRLVSYFENKELLPGLAKELAIKEQQLALSTTANESDKAAAKAKRRAEAILKEQLALKDSIEANIAQFESDPQLRKLAEEHPNIGQAVLDETAKLHHGDAENRQLWQEFLPACEADIDRIYARLHVSFDYTLGESFYQDRLAVVVDELLAKGIARESEGAICVFNDGDEAPFIIRKQDGAFLYATTDLATIQYRVDTWHPDAVLYVVDHRQSLHFVQLFATARRWDKQKYGNDALELEHVAFGTVLGDDGRPFKTRSGDTVGLEGLLDEAVRRAHQIVSQNDDAKPDGPEISPDERQRIAERVGIGALKYADLAVNRTSDYTFSYDRMLAMNGNTATYMQYAHARVLSIFAKGSVDTAALRAVRGPIALAHPAERALALALLQFSEALAQTAAEYRPNFLTAYLFEVANRYSTFFEQCPVLKAPDEATRTARLRLCDLTARTLRQGLELLGIEVVDKM